jgi:diketogulonate reductase-like aldo/keto reductase
LIQALVDAGLTKSIGVSNFGTAMLVDMMTYARIPPAMNQIEVNPLHTREDLITFCHQFNIQVTAYSQFGSTGASYLKLEPVVAIAEKHKKTPAQVILRWLLDQNIVAIPKSVGAARIKENINVFDFKLSEDEIKQISACNKNEGTNVAKEFFGLNIFV